MQDSNVPEKFPIPFAADATGLYIRPIPETSADPTAASLTLGYPPDTFLQIGAGGSPPDGRDMNGILNQITLWNQWQQAGGTVAYDPTFSAAIGGYPAGAILASASTGAYWVSLVDNNVTDPDTGGGGWVRLARLQVASNLTFYVSTTGSDSTGTGAIGAPFATRQHAWNVLQQNYDLGGQYVCTIQIEDGTYTDRLACIGPIMGSTSPYSVLFTGNSGTPANVLISVPGDNSFLGQNGALFTVANLKVAASFGINGQSCAQIFYNNINFGACSIAHVSSQNGASVSAAGPCSVSGNSPFHLRAVINGFIQMGIAVNFSAPVTFANQFAVAATVGTIEAAGASFSGSPVTGQRYLAQSNGVIETNAGGANFFPGTVAGSTTTGGQYV